MRNGNLNSKMVLEQASLTGRQQLAQSTGESSYLAIQDKNARTAIGRTLRSMKETIKGMVSIKDHPWVFTGTAVAAGLAVGGVLAYSHGKGTHQPLSNEPAESQSGCPKEQMEKARKSVLFSTLGTILAGTLKIVVRGLLTHAVIGNDRIETHSPHDSVDGSHV